MTKTFIRSRGSLQNHTRFQTKMVKIYTPFSDQNGSKAIPFEEAHTYIAYIGEYPPPGYCVSLTIWRYHLTYFLVTHNRLSYLIRAALKTEAIVLCSLTSEQCKRPWSEIMVESVNKKQNNETNTLFIQRRFSS